MRFSILCGAALATLILAGCVTEPAPGQVYGQIGKPQKPGRAKKAKPVSATPSDSFLPRVERTVSS